MTSSSASSSFKTILGAILPESAWDYGKRMYLSQKARRFSDECSGEKDLGRLVDLGLRSEQFPLGQVKSEFVRLLSLLRQNPPRRLCEIGGRSGGSLAMLTQVATADARLLSIDFEYKPVQRDVLSALARPQQHVTCVTADSHAQHTIDLVRNWLAGETLDFLFIDGDHSYEGAKRDFIDYSPFVKPGGIIAFHDIVPDSFMRTGVRTSSDVGGVPVLWKEVKQEQTRTDEFVDSWEQDGYGIGIVHWAGHTKP